MIVAGSSQGAGRRYTEGFNRFSQAQARVQVFNVSIVPGRGAFHRPLTLRSAWKPLTLVSGNGRRLIVFPRPDRAEGDRLRKLVGPWVR
jgi:hypothetical protein